MGERVIPLIDQRAAARRVPAPAFAPAPTGELLDARGRPLHDLRISVTDRCNFRCSYCMPKEVFDSMGGGGAKGQGHAGGGTGRAEGGRSHVGWAPRKKTVGMVVA